MATLVRDTDSIWTERETRLARSRFVGTTVSCDELEMSGRTVVLPARPRAPQDKAKVEAAVQNVERWIMAPLRNQTFFSLGELREAIAPLLAALNERPFQKTEGSRRSWFEDLDRPALKPLPAQRYEYAEWRKACVNIDYHIQAGDDEQYALSLPAEHAHIRGPQYYTTPQNGKES